MGSEGGEARKECVRGGGGGGGGIKAERYNRLLLNGLV